MILISLKELSTKGCQYSTAFVPNSNEKGQTYVARRGRAEDDIQNSHIIYIHTIPRGTNFQLENKIKIYNLFIKARRSESLAASENLTEIKAQNGTFENVRLEESERPADLEKETGVSKIQ